jgi:membrane-associated phospholipid phosphatase
MPSPNWRLHGFMAAACFGLFSISAGFHLAGTELIAVAIGPMIAILPALIFHDLGKSERRDAALTLPWIALLNIVLPRAVIGSARFRLAFRDDLFMRTDRSLGISVPAIVAWFSHHGLLRGFFEGAYYSLTPMICLAVLLPALGGKKESAERFLFANVVAFLIAVPVFTALPAIGPWVGNFPGNGQQRATETAMAALNSASICFPSFHVTWAILSAWALRPIRWLRIPAMILAVLIVISTVTTGWHYSVDVLGGIVLAAVAIYCSKALFPSGASTPAFGRGRFRRHRPDGARQVLADQQRATDR